MATISDIKTPSITTLSVQIKALKIGKKSFTLTVFDQLPERKPTIDSIIWGRVKRKTEYWCVHQESGVLCKSMFSKPGIMFKDIWEYANTKFKDYYYKPVIYELVERDVYCRGNSDEYLLDFEKYGIGSESDFYFKVYLGSDEDSFKYCIKARREEKKEEYFFIKVLLSGEFCVLKGLSYNGFIIDWEKYCEGISEKVHPDVIVEYEKCKKKYKDYLIIYDKITQSDHLFIGV
jgi:hypothetical protein